MFTQHIPSERSMADDTAPVLPGRHHKPLLQTWVDFNANMDK